MKELQDTAVASADRPPAPPVPSALDPLAFARWWVQERGLSVIALDHPHAPVASQAHQIGKVPVASWKAFHACQPTDGNLRVWFGIGTPRNKGIGTGAISDGVAVGCDSLEADEWARGTPPIATTTVDGFRHTVSGSLGSQPHHSPHVQEHPRRVVRDAHDPTTA